MELTLSVLEITVFRENIRVPYLGLCRAKELAQRGVQPMSMSMSMRARMCPKKNIGVLPCR